MKIVQSRRSRSRSRTASPCASPAARSTPPTTCWSACTPTTAWSASPRRRRGRTPTARPRTSIVAVIEQAVRARAGRADPRSTARSSARGWSAPSATRPPRRPSTWRSGTPSDGPSTCPSPSARRLHRPDAGLPHGRVRDPTPRWSPRPSASATATESDLQGEGRPAPGRARRRRVPGAAGSAWAPDVELYVDGNRGWTPSEAARALQRDGRSRPDAGRGALPGRRRARPPLARRRRRPSRPSPTRARRRPARSPASCSAARRP